MANFLTDEIVSLNGTEEFSIHNLLSNLQQLYTLTTPYVLALEVIDGDTCTYLVITPENYSIDNWSISKEPLLQNRTLHKHNYYELMIVLHGTVEQHVEDQSYFYHSGQCCLLNPNVRHVEGAVDSAEILFLGLSPAFFETLRENDFLIHTGGQSVLNQNPIFQILQGQDSPIDQLQKHYIDFMPRVPSETFTAKLEQQLSHLMCECRQQQPGQHLFVQGYIIRLFHLLADPSKYILRFVDLKNTKEEHLFAQIQLLLEKSNGRISRKELSEKLNYNDHYLNRIVQQQTGMSLKRFGRIFLLKKAAQMLLQTDQNVDQIALALGISNTTYFHRIFKEEYGVTPSNYRQRNTQ